MAARRVAASALLLTCAAALGWFSYAQWFDHEPSNAGNRDAADAGRGGSLENLNGIVGEKRSRDDEDVRRRWTHRGCRWHTGSRLLGADWWYAEFRTAAQPQEPTEAHLKELTSLLLQMQAHVDEAIARTESEIDAAIRDRICHGDVTSGHDALFADSMRRHGEDLQRVDDPMMLETLARDYQKIEIKRHHFLGSIVGTFKVGKQELGTAMKDEDCAEYMRAVRDESSVHDDVREKLRTLVRSFKD